MKGSGSDEAKREQASARLRQRLWGAAVLIALAVIVLPVLLDGSGSESQFRRVERLREEPPRIVNGDLDGRTAVGSSVRLDDERDVPDERRVEVVVPDTLPAVRVEVTGGDEETPRIRVGEDDPPDYLREPVIEPIGADGRGTETDLVRAWVVQAGSFRDRANALAVRDRLRRAGHPTFITDARQGGASLHRVRVGPMVDQVRAEGLRDEVIALLGRDAIVVPYP